MICRQKGQLTQMAFFISSPVLRAGDRLGIVRPIIPSNFSICRSSSLLLIPAWALYRRVAERSLAQWKCISCHGSGNTNERRICVPCKGSGRGKICVGEFEPEKALDMVSELEGLLCAYNSRANSRLR
jgi:hypothetical protein